MNRDAATPVTRTVRVLRSREDVLEHRAAWDALPMSQPDARPDAFLCVIDALPGALRPHVVLMERDGELIGILVARLEQREFPARFGYATVYRPRLRCLTVVAGGVCGTGDDQALLVAELLDALAQREADAVMFDHVDAGSRLHQEALGQTAGWTRQRFLEPSTHWVLDLPPEGEAFLPQLPKRLRDKFKRSRKLVHREFGDRATVRRFADVDDLDEALVSLETVAARTYQRGLGAGFSAERDRPLVELGLQQGSFRAWVLAIDGAPCAFELGSVHGDRFVVGAKGYDPDFAKSEIGTALQLQVLEDLCDDPGIRTVDFGFGDAAYKRRLASRHWEEVDVLVYGRTSRGLAVNAVCSAILGTDRLARRLAGPERIGRVKRRWRALRTPNTIGA